MIMMKEDEKKLYSKGGGERQQDSVGGISFLSGLDGRGWSSQVFRSKFDWMALIVNKLF